MSCDFLSLALPNVQTISPYVPGKPIEELARELNLNPENIIKLASNENPLGPSERAITAIHNELAELTRYPDGNGFVLKTALATYYQCAPEQITLGNGSNDTLEIIARAFLGKGLNAVYSQYAFAVYPLITLATGAEGREVPAKNWGHDLEAMLAAIDDNTRLVFIANPNNPTGTWFTSKTFEQFLSKVPKHVLVVLDEAYIEYAQNDNELPDGLTFLNRYSNLIVSRTFSKAYGLAAMRVGYTISHPAIVDILNRVRQPFNVNSLAIVAAASVLTDFDYLAKSQKINNDGMSQLENGLKSLGLTPLASKGNFIAVDMGKNALPIFNQLLSEGVIVRPLAGYGMTNHLRISIGLEQENEQCIRALTKVLRG